MICRHTLRYKWMIIICTDRPSGTNWLSWSAETHPQVKMDNNDLQRQTLNYKWMIMIWKIEPQVQTDDNDLQTHHQVGTDDHDLQTYPQVQTDDHDLYRQTLRYKWRENFVSNKIAKFRRLTSCHLLSWIPFHFYLRLCLCKSLSPFLTNLSLMFMHLNKWPHNWPPEQPAKKQETYELTYFYTYTYVYTHTHTYTHTSRTNKQTRVTSTKLNRWRTEMD